MFRRLSVIAFVLLATQAGCRSRCDGHRGFFSSHTRGPAPCQTVGRNGGCFDAATGQPVPCPPEGVGMVIPGGAMPGPALPGPAFPNVGPRPDELHMPNPSSLIPSPAVPIPAPPPPGEASLPFPSSAGTPVRSGQK